MLKFAKILFVIMVLNGSALHASYLPSNMYDGAGNALTSQVNGSKRALDVGINVSGVQVDPRTRTWSLSSGSDSVAVTGSFWQATQPVSIASSVPVTGTFWQATQPVSLSTVPTHGVTGTFWQATQPVSIASMPSTPVTGTFWQATQPVSAASLPTPLDQSTSGTISALNGAVTLAVHGVSEAVFTVTGTWVGSLNAQGSNDGVTWDTLTMFQASLWATTPATTNGNFRVTGLSGFTQFRVIALAYTSGTASVLINATAGMNIMNVKQGNAANLKATVNLQDGSGNSLSSTGGALNIAAASLPLPAGAATDASLATLGSKIPNLGPAAPSASQPMTMSTNVSVNGGSALSAVNTDLLTGSVSGWYDAGAYHSVSIQVIGSAGISAGQVFFEQTNDTTNASAGQPWPVFESAIVNANPNIAAFSIAASTSRIFEAPITSRYIRVRISTAFTGGTVQATGIMSQAAFSRSTLSMQQATAASLNTTATIASGTVTTVSTVTSVTAVASVTSANAAIPGIIADVASAALTTTATTATLTPTFGSAYIVSIPVTVVSGTTPTLDVEVQESDDTGTNWFAVYDFPRITTTGIYRSPPVLFTGNRIRYVQTVTGTTPSFTRAVNRLQVSPGSAAVYRQLVDRTISLTTLSSSTPVLTTGGAKNAQVVVNIGTATVAPAIQIQGSDDAGATWYAVGAPLTAVASSTVQLTVNNMTSQMLRATVSTAGTTVVAGYVLIRAF